MAETVNFGRNNLFRPNNVFRAFGQIFGFGFGSAFENRLFRLSVFRQKICFGQPLPLIENSSLPLNRRRAAHCGSAFPANSFQAATSSFVAPMRGQEGSVSSKMRLRGALNCWLRCRRPRRRLASLKGCLPVRDTCKAIVKRLVHDKVGSQFKKIK